MPTISENDEPDQPVSDVENDEAALPLSDVSGKAKPNVTTPTPGGTPPTTALDEGPDPFDPATYRKRVATAAVRVVQTSVAVKKPSKQTFVRASVDPQFHIDATLYTQEGGSRSSFLVVPGFEGYLDGLAVPVTLVWMIDNQGEHFLCPTRPESDNAWSFSLCELVAAAKVGWVRLKSAEGHYNYAVPTEEELPEPVWPPDMTPRDLLRLAFKGKVIDQPDHSAIQKLRAGRAR
jgi:hypothetical protein